MGVKTKTSWKPGQSGNPAGRAKTGQTYRDVLREIGESDTIKVDLETTVYDEDGKAKKIRKKYFTKVTDKRKGKNTCKAALSNIIYSKAVSGDIKFVREVIDREDGKAVQPLEHTGQMAIDHFFDVVNEVDDDEE